MERIFDEVYGPIVKCPACLKRLKIHKNETRKAKTCMCGKVFSTKKGRLVK